MSNGLKQQWGLGDAKAAPSTAQADEFKAAYQALLNGVNTALQYTVINAEKPKHNDKASERDGLNSTYQAVLVKIDPSNPSAAQSAIQAALAAAKSTATTVAAFKTEVEKAVAAWQAKEPEYQRSVTMVEELEAWGHKQATVIRTIVGKIQTQVNEKALDPAVKAVVELMSKLQPIYDEYLKQVDAKKQYDPAVQALQPKLPAECRFKKLEPNQQEIESVKGKMEAAANDKDYVTALPLATDLTTKIDAYQTAVADLEKKKAEYEQALAALQQKLADASTCKYTKLEPQQKEIDALKGKMEAAATDEDYDQALTLVTELSTKLDEFSAAVADLDKKKGEYEQALEGAKPKLADAMAGPIKYQKLETQQQEVVTAKGQMETAAQEEDFDQALTKVNEVSAKADEYQKAVSELDKKKEEYDQKLAALQPKLTDASQSKYEKLAPIQQDMATIQGEMEKAAQAEDYEAAIKLLGDLSAKVDEYLEAKKKLEEEKEQYEQAMTAMQPRLTEASQSKAKDADLQPIQQDMVTIQTEMDTAAKAQDYENALRLQKDLATKIEEYFAAIEKKKQEYQTALAAVQPKLDDCLIEARDFTDLKSDRDALSNAQKDMEVAANAQDYDKAKQMAIDLVAKADAYLAAAKKKQEEYDKKGAEYSKKLDDASDATRGDVAKAIANGMAGKPEEIKHLPIDVRNRLLEEMQKGSFTDDEKKASKILLSQKFLDPEFEKLEMKQRRELIEKMKNDPEYKHARDNWDKLTEKERIAIMQKTIDYQADIYGIPKASVVPFPTPIKDGDYGTYSHTPPPGQLNINTHDSVLKKGGFDEAIDTAVHEMGHRQQATMVDDLSNPPPPDQPKIKKGDPKYNQAQSFKLNDTQRGYFVYPPDYPGQTPSTTGPEYFTQPQENHSRENAGQVKAAGIGTK